MPDARRRTMELHRMAQTQTDNELRQILWAEQGSRYRCANEQMILDQRTGSDSLPLAHSLLAHQGDKRGATLPHKPITTPIPDGVIGLWSDSCSMSILLYEHRQSCPGVTQAVLYASPLHPFHPKVVKIGREHTSSGDTL